MRSDFSRIPEDILLQIFSEVMLGDPQAIGPILFVCRSWNRIACNHPILWTNIILKPDPNPASIQRETEYLRAAFRYSRSASLDHTLHLFSREDVWRDIATRIWSHLSVEHPDYRFSADVHTKQTKMVQWFDDVRSHYEDEIDTYCPRSSEISDLLHRQIRMFTGDDGGGNQGEDINEDGQPESRQLGGKRDRITSLTIYYDSSKYRDWLNAGEDGLLEWFYPMPQRLAVVDKSPKVLRMEWPVYEESNANLRYLSWRSGYHTMRVASIPQLVHLRLHWRNEIVMLNSWRSNLPEPKFTENLRCLFLYISEDVSITENLRLNQRPQPLPQLEDLTLAGKFDATIFKALDTPRLTTLRLIEPMAVGVLRERPLVPTIPLDKIRKIHVHNDLFDNKKLSLEEVLTIFPSAMELGIVRSVVDDVKDCRMRLKDEMKRDVPTIRGFKYSPEDYWSFDTNDYHEI